jgi:hypothetical protein
LKNLWRWEFGGGEVEEEEEVVVEVEFVEQEGTMGGVGLGTCGEGGVGGDIVVLDVVVVDVSEVVCVLSRISKSLTGGLEATTSREGLETPSLLSHSRKSSSPLPPKLRLELLLVRSNSGV